MNEPHDIPDLQSWADSVQAAVTAIRAAGATSQVILIPGSSYASAQTLPTEAGPYLLKVTDPIGGTAKLLFDGTRLTHFVYVDLLLTIFALQCTSTSTATTPERTPTARLTTPPSSRPWSPGSSRTATGRRSSLRPVEAAHLPARRCKPCAVALFFPTH